MYRRQDKQEKQSESTAYFIGILCSFSIKKNIFLKVNFFQQ